MACITHALRAGQADLGNFALSTLLAACIILSGGSKKQLSNFGIQARSGRDTRGPGISRDMFVIPE